MVGIIEVLLFLAVVGYFFNKSRGTDMVDIISNRVQEAYGSFRLPGMFGTGGGGTTQTVEAGGFSTYAMLKRFGEPNRRQRQMNKDNERKRREESLYQMKESAPPHLTPDIREGTSGLACRFCSPDVPVQTQLDDADRRRTAIDILRVTSHAGRRTDSDVTDWGVWCPHLAQAARVKKFDYPQVEGAVLGEDRVQQAMETACNESVNEKRQELIAAGEGDESFDEDSYYNQMLKKHQKRAQKVLVGMRSKLSHLALTITSWVLYKLLPCFISGVAAHPGQVDMIKRAIAAHPDAPLIFLPLHRSHLDYIMVSFILLNHDIRCPLVAGGDNLRIPVFGNILRYDGAFFIKRKIDPLTGKKDHVYRAILHTYLQKVLTAGHNVEFFIEGGRTRTGKPCMPKSGILSVIVDAFNDRSIADALIVPVSINYEKLVDGNFVREQLGQKKIPESFWSAAAGIVKVLKARYGLMRIDFNEPFALSELVRSLRVNASQDVQYGPDMKRLQHKPSSSSLFGTDVVQEEQELRHLVDSIARHVVYDCAKATSVMTTNALAFLLLNRFRDGAPLSILAEALDEMRRVLEGASRDLGFTGTSEDVIKYAAELLGPGLVLKETRNGQLFIKPVTLVPNVIELAYYSNSLIPHFALDSIVITSAVLLHRSAEKRLRDQQQSTDDVSVGRRQLHRTCLEFCDLMKYEFILSKPCQSLDTLLDDCIDKLRDRELLAQPTVEYTDEQQAAQRLAAHMELDDYYDDTEDSFSDGMSDQHNNASDDDDLERMFLPAERHCDRIVLQSVLAPFTNTYTAVAVSLNALVGGNSMVEGEFIKQCIREITSRVEAGECKYGESISTDTVRNCLKYLEKRSNIEITNNAGVRIVSLAASFDSTEQVQTIIDSMERFVPI